MSANLKAYDKFMRYCRQLLPQERITRLRNLALLVLAVVTSTDSHLSSLAEAIGLAASDLSLEQRIRRWLKNEQVDVRRWYEPFVRTALQLYYPHVIYLVMDSTQYGPACRALVVGIAYGGQVLPLGWRVVKGKKGHTDPDLQNALLDEIRPYLPPGQVVLVADSEFCAVELLAPLTSWQWKFIVRVRSNISLCPNDAPAFLLSSVALQPGQTRLWRAVQWTQKHHFGPLMVIATWRKGEEEPLYVITNTHNVQAAFLVYGWRFWIEPLFADFKGRGFRLAQTRLRDPERLNRLLLVAAIAFLWTLAVGSHIFHTPNQRLVDRNDRTDRSFFQLGYRFIKRQLKLAEPLFIRFNINPKWIPFPLTL
jgi:hypothetical protein